MKHHLIAMPIALIISLVPANLVQAEREIIFAQGKNSTIIKGRVEMYNKTYSFRAKKGQRLRLELFPQILFVFLVMHFHNLGVPSDATDLTPLVFHIFSMFLALLPIPVYLELPFAIGSPGLMG
jgi:hypothetical protein